MSVETLGESEQGDENDEEVGATVHSSLVESTEEIPGSSSVLEASSRGVKVYVQSTEEKTHESKHGVPSMDYIM